MQQVCRVGDIGVGVCHGHRSPRPYVTVFITGASETLVDDLPMATVATLGVNSCGHLSMAVSGSSVATATNDMPPHRTGDVGVSLAGGVYVAASGSGVSSSD